MLLTSQLAPLFTGDNAISLSGVFDEIVGLLPIVIPVMVSFIALRKGISFLQGVLHGA